MNLLEFQAASRRTMPFNGEPQNRVCFDNIFSNYAMGLIGESVECFQIVTADYMSEEDVLKLKKELGDVSHYAVGLAAIAHIPIPDYVESDEDAEDISVCETIDKLICVAGAIVEHAKKVIYHRHAFDANEIDVVEVLCLINKLAIAHGFKFSEVLAENIEKIKTRFPNGFNSEDSKARVDEHGE